MKGEKMKSLLKVGLVVLLFCIFSFDMFAEGTAEESSSEEDVSLRVLVMYEDQARVSIHDNYYQKNLDQLPGIDLEIELGGGGANYLDKLKVYYAANDLPDVFWTGGVAAARPLYDGNALVDLKPYITSDGFAEKYDSPSGVRYFRGGVYAIEAGTDSYFTPRILYRKSVFADNGVSVPKTYKELLDVCIKLSSKGIVPISTVEFFLRAGLFQELLMADNPQYLKDLIDGKTTITDKPYVDAFARMRELAEAGAFPKDVTTIPWGAHIELFNTGKAAMLLNFSWVIPGFAGDEDIDLMPFPSINSDTTQAHQMWGHPLNGFAVSAVGPDIDAGVKTAEYLSLQDATFFRGEQKSPTLLNPGIELTDVDRLMQKHMDATLAAAQGLPCLYSYMSPDVNAENKIISGALVSSSITALEASPYESR
jgi:raffinose/stachyose/melibiose transport system substrate-binding protein